MIGRKFLAALKAQPDGVHRYLRLNARPEWFLGLDAPVFELVNNHVTKYGAFPQDEAMKGIELPIAEESPAYYLDLLKRQFMHQTMKDGVATATAHLNASEQDEALLVLQASILQCLKAGAGNRIMDYAAEGHDILMAHLTALEKGTINKVLTGWQSLDLSTNGLGPGDVVTIVGRPANGKTFMLLWAALQAWRQGHTPLLFSMEMNHIAITERLAAMQAPVNLTQIKKGQMSTLKKGVLGATLLGNVGKKPFWLVDGALSATVEDVISYSHHLQPDIVIIDGAYLMRSRENLPRWERVTRCLELIKGEVAEALGIPVIISYQLNREAAKKQDKGIEVGLEDIGYTDAVGQISSVVLGLMEDDNVKTLKRREVKVLKGRDGQSNKFWIKWQFEQHLGLDFSETTAMPEIGELTNV